MTWVLIGKIHLRTEQISTFHHQLGKLFVWCIGDSDPMVWMDPDRELYIRLCEELGVAPAEEGDYD